jgi:hypothetical protein
VIKAAKQNVTVHKGHPGMLSHDEALYILDFYEQLDECGIPVNSQLLGIALQRFSPQLNQVSVVILQHRVLCMMKNNKYHALMCYAQGTKYSL